MENQIKTTTSDKLCGYGALFFSTFCYTGMLPWLIGKRGKGGGLISSIFTTAALILFYFYSQSLPGENILLLIFILAWVSFFFGLFIVGTAEEFMLLKWGRRARHNGEEVVEDFNETTIDEVHGMLLAVSPIYFYQLVFWQFLLLQIIALITFRFFDVKKIWPVKKIENWQKDNKETSPLRVMLDDTISGIYAMVIVLICLFVLKIF